MSKNLISVVDDDASVLRTTTLLIESLGFRAAGFESAELFLKSGQLQETSCLIVDVRMPGVSGLQLQSHLAALGCAIPIIFITAYDDNASRLRALQAGAISHCWASHLLTRFYFKPFVQPYGDNWEEERSHIAS